MPWTPRLYRLNDEAYNELKYIQSRLGVHSEAQAVRTAIRHQYLALVPDGSPAPPAPPPPPTTAPAALAARDDAKKRRGGRPRKNPRKSPLPS
jgi:hypothetical protein